MSKKPWERVLPRAPNKGKVVRSIVLDHIRWYEMRPVPLIHQRVVDDYGIITCRSVYRHIKALVEIGVIKKVHDDSEDTFGYVRTSKPRWDRSEQVYA
jgi:Fe2+ or Zn2+ uptake regulation protein